MRLSNDRKSFRYKGKEQINTLLVTDLCKYLNIWDKAHKRCKQVAGFFFVFRMIENRFVTKAKNRSILCLCKYLNIWDKAHKRCKHVRSYGSKKYTQTIKTTVTSLKIEFIDEHEESSEFTLHQLIICAYY